MSRRTGMSRRLALTVALLAMLAPALVGAAQRGMPEDIGGVPEEKQFEEDRLKLPSPPQDSGLIEFRPRGSSNNRYYIDGNSVSLGADRVVRYTLVVKSPSGVANVSYEGLRCKTSEYKVYAYGTKSGEWTGARDPKWRPVGVSSSNFHYSLWVDYLCDSEAVGGRNARDLVARLRGDPLNNFDLKER